MIKSELSDNIELLKSQPYLDFYESLPDLSKGFFNHPLFLYECLKAFKGVDEGMVFSVFKKDKLIGFDAFRRTNITLRKVKISCLVPAGFRISEYNSPSIDPSSFGDFFQELSAATANDSLFYHNATGIMTEWFKRKVDGAYVYSHTPNPIIRQSEIIKEVGKKKNLVRNYKSLVKKTKVSIEHQFGKISEETLEEFYLMHIKRWKSEGVDSKFLKSEYKDIYKSLSKLDILPYGNLVLSHVRSDDNYLAMHIGFKIKETFLYQIPAFDLDQKNYSPGTVLLKSLFDYTADNDMEVFDLGYGLEDYKFRYCNDVLYYYSIARFSNPLIQNLFKINIQ
jgi:hypothetical protein